MSRYTMQSRNGDRYRFNEFIDGEFKVMEYSSPTSKVTIKYSNSWMIYTQDDKVVYNGPYDPEKQKAALKEFEETQKKWEEEWKKSYNDMFKDFEESQKKREEEWQRSYNDLFKDFSSQTPTIGKSTSQKSDSGCCLVSLLLGLFWLVILCMIIYGMGKVGFNVVEFLKNLI